MVMMQFERFVSKASSNSCFTNKINTTFGVTYKILFEIRRGHICCEFWSYQRKRISKIWCP